MYSAEFVRGNTKKTNRNQIMMTQERFDQIWNAATGGPSSDATENCDTNGMSPCLASAINSAEASDVSLALTDWTEADY
jgi:hypothetical protein